MKTQKIIVHSIFILMAMLFSACQTILPRSAAPASDTQETGGAAPSPSTTTTQIEAAPPSPTPTPQVTVPPTDSSLEDKPDTPTPGAKQDSSAPDIPVPVGPEDYPEGVNPLTGLPADDPELLALPPALISISNFPASARPQAGLNSSPITFEIAIGEGMTRFLAMFYGGYPGAVSGQTEGVLAGTEGDPETDDGVHSENAATASIGPIRSGRLPYEDVRSLYTGFLVMASAWEGVTTQLSETTSVYGSDGDDINSALVSVDQLRQIAQAQKAGQPGSSINLTGMQFSQILPEGGQPAPRLWVFYSMLNQVQWQYDPMLDAYIRYDIKTDGSGEFVMATDRLSGDPVSKENVIILYAEHDYRAPTLIDINLINQPATKALLLRDGQIHEMYWTTRFGDYEQETGLLRPIRFVDSEGHPISLKPGQTWIHVVSLSSYHTESVISDQPFHPVTEEPGSGLWLVRYKGKY